ncbi:MAG: prepilin peptidase [Proteobacteria bacterium]|nr:prepilin peptidase [Pseudomonadota bacterium]
MTTTVLAGLLIALLLVSALWDLRHREIPDACSLGLLLLAAASVVSGHLPWSAALLGFAACFLLGLFLFWLGAWGGGDAKLAAAIGAALGFPGVLPALFFAALAGGVLAAIAGLRGQREVAYGPAFAAGVVMALVVR